MSRQKHLVAAAQGATHLPKEGAQGARMNSHASDLVAEGRQACTDVPRKARCPRGHHVHAARYEVPRDAIPQTRSPAPRPVDRRPQAVDTPRPVDISSCTTRQWTGLSNPQRGLAPVVRQARTTPGWHTQEQFSPPLTLRCRGDERAATRLFSWEGNPAAQVPTSKQLFWQLP